MHSIETAFEVLINQYASHDDVVIESRFGVQMLSRQGVPFAVKTNDDLLLLMLITELPADMSEKICHTYSDKPGGIGVAWLPTIGMRMPELIKMTLASYRESGVFGQKALTKIYMLLEQELIFLFPSIIEELPEETANVNTIILVH